MKKCGMGMVVLLFVALLAGCTGAGNSSSLVAPAPSSVGTASSTSDATQAQKAVQLVQDMMALDYNNMTVTAFNETIQQICTDAGTDIFAVIADAYDDYLDFDRELDTFMRTTLNYSSQQLFGEPVHIGTASYMATPNTTAREMLEIENSMSAREWDKYFDGIIGEIEVLVVVHYEIAFEMTDPDNLLVAQRDNQLNGICAEIENALVEKSSEEVVAEGIEDSFALMVKGLSDTYSDDNMRVDCRMTLYENADNM